MNASNMKQGSLGLARPAGKSCKREFLEEVDRVVPWAMLTAGVEAHGLGTYDGNSSFAVEAMLRLHCLQQWLSVSDTAMEEALRSTPLYREFAGLANADGLPGKCEIRQFRDLLENDDLAPRMIELLNDMLSDLWTSRRSLLQARSELAVGEVRAAPLAPFAGRPACSGRAASA